MKKDIDLQLIQYLLRNPTTENLEGARAIITDMKDTKTAMVLNKKLISVASQHIQKEPSSKNFEIYKKALLYAAPYDFDSFLLYIEFDREPNERFYLPRRSVLSPIVSGLQALADDEMDTLFVSQPARTGKTTLCIFYIAWLCGRFPEKTNLACAYSDKVTKMFYDGVLEVCTDHVTYLYSDVFPDAKIVDTNSRDETLDFKRKKKYKTLTCRSIDGSLNGTCDCNGLLYGDDLVSGIEEALSTDRMVTLWGKISNNLIPRQKRTAKSLYVGTRWSVADPIGKLISLYETEPAYRNIRYKIVNLPALNEKGESNFDYAYNLGFTTNDFLQKKATMDEPSWLAQCMGEPIERYGLVFDPSALNYYNGVLPDGEPDAIYAAADVAWGGGDSFSMPIGYVYGQSCYVADVLFSNGSKDVTRPQVVAKLLKHRPTLTRFEANNGGHEYKDRVDEILQSKGVKIPLISVTTSSRTTKEVRILMNAPDIIRDFYFLDLNKRDDQYRAFMRELTSFSQTKKNKHDDAPDSVSMLQDMRGGRAITQVFKRPF